MKKKMLLVIPLVFSLMIPLSLPVNTQAAVNTNSITTYGSKQYTVMMGRYVGPTVTNFVIYGGKQYKVTHYYSHMQGGYYIYIGHIFF